MENKLRILSVREYPQYEEKFITYFQSKWPDTWGKIYEDCIHHSLTAFTDLPQWYLLQKDEEVIGGVGLVTNDFISRMDLYPWICALFIEEKYRGNSYGAILLEKAKRDAAEAGFSKIYLSTDHIGYYEKYGFSYIGQGYHPWQEESRIYESILEKKDVSEELDFYIRTEKDKEYDEIYHVIQTAFQTAQVKDGDEQEYAVKLRKSQNYIPELALVAEKEQRIIGHIMLTKTVVYQSDEIIFNALLLSPLSVLIEHRNKGVGSALVRESLRRAKLMGYTAVFLCGDPAYYGRFGFIQSSGFGIYPSTTIPQEYVLVCELVKGGLSSIKGKLECC